LHVLEILIKIFSTVAVPLPEFAVLRLLYPIVEAIQPFLVPICFVCAWGLMAMVAWSLWSAVSTSVKNAKRMHQIPCPHCQFFTNDYRLKCPVNPTTAMSEQAIDCPDYREVRR
jgi:hypothetical protein